MTISASLPFSTDKPRESPLDWLSWIVAWAVFVSILVLLIDAAVPQLQMAISGGYLGNNFVRFKFVVIFGGVYFALVNGLKGLGSRLYLMWFLFLTYAVGVIFLQPLYTNHQPIFLLISFVDNFSLLLFLPILLAMGGVINPVQVRRVLFLVFVPLALLGIAQFVTSEPIVRPMSLDGRFMVNSWTISGRARGFSLFTSGLRFGYFIAMIAAVAAACVLLGKYGQKIRFARVILTLALLACAATLTRNVYVMVLEAIFAAYLLTRGTRWARNYALALPLVYGGIALALTVVAPLVSDALSRHTVVLSGDSMNIRLREWQHYMALWLQSDLPTMFFGTGISQMSRFQSMENSVVIDNVFIATGVQLGIVGLLLFVFIYWQMWVYQLRALAAAPRDPLLVGLVAYWSTAFASGFFNVSQPTYLTIFVIFVLCASGRSIDQKGASNHAALG